MLVTVPIGAWVSSLVFDVASRLASKPAFLGQASQWLIAIGVAGAVLAAIAGFADMMGIPAGTAAFRTARIHMTVNVLVTFAYAGNFAVRYRTQPHGGAVSLAMLALSVACIAALGVSGHLGGKLTYRYGVRVGRFHQPAQRRQVAGEDTYDISG
jgi:uncharacterized membrane protein